MHMRSTSERRRKDIFDALRAARAEYSPKTTNRPKRKNFKSYGEKLHSMITGCDRQWRKECTDERDMIAHWSDDGKAFIFEENEGFKFMLKTFDICESNDIRAAVRNMNAYGFKIEQCEGREGVVTRKASHPLFSTMSTTKDLGQIKRKKKNEVAKKKKAEADQNDTVQQRLDEMNARMNEMKKMLCVMLQHLCANALGANSPFSNGQKRGSSKLNMEPSSEGPHGFDDTRSPQSEEMAMSVGISESPGRKRSRSEISSICSPQTMPVSISEGTGKKRNKVNPDEGDLEARKTFYSEGPHCDGSTGSLETTSPSLEASFDVGDLDALLEHLQD